MENDSISSTPSESKLPLIIGVVAFALGAAGLVVGIKAKSAAQAATDAATSAQQAAADVGAAVASKAPLSEVQAVRDQVAAIQQDANANFTKVNDAIAALQKAATTPKAAGGSSKGSTPAGPGEYAVVKGDTLSGIAKKNGISLKAIQDLNPGVDATRLQIGQKLKVK